MPSVGGPVEWIEGQEASGQAELVAEAGTRLPIKLGHGTTEEEIRGMGVTLGDPILGDSQFRYAELPGGWSVVRTAQPLWTEVLDETGSIRLRVFYKAVFYDRRAMMHVVRDGES